MSTSDRRGAVADVVIEIVATRGLDAVSVREVAAGLNASIGAIQHHFSTKAEMLSFAFERVVERTRRRVTGRPLTGDPAADIASALRELLPLDEARRIDATVTLAFASLAATNPELQRIQAHLLTTIRGELVERLGPHSETRAAVLLAAVDGLALHEVSAPGTLTPSAIIEALEFAINAALRPDER